MRFRVLLLVALAVVFAPGSASAQDKGPAPSCAAEIDAARKLVADGRWKDAKDAIDKLLAARANDPLVAAKLPEIEDDLKRATFKLAWKAPTTAAMLGAAKFNSGRAEFDVAQDDKHWLGSEEVRVFDVQFENEVSIEFDWYWSDTGRSAPPKALLAFDREKDTGYILGFDYGPSYGPGPKYASGFVRRLSGGATTDIGTSTAATFDRPGTRQSVVRYERTAQALVCRVNGKEVARASDVQSRSGLVAMGTDPHLGRLRIVGRLADAFVRRVTAEAENSAYRAWEEKEWNRADALPGWALADAPRPGGAVPLPRDAPGTGIDSVRKAIARYYAGDEDPFDELAEAEEADADKLPPALGAYLEGVRALHEGAYDVAQKALASVVTADPDFVPGHVGLARALFEQGDVENARAVLKGVVLRAGAFSPAYELAAELAMHDGELAAARAALDAAAAKGCTSPHARELRAALLRVERGPPWTKRFDHQTEHFDVASDHSKAVCAEIATKLEEAYSGYQARFRPFVAKRRARVYVFSGAQSYLDYAADLGINLQNSLGVYMPPLRQLAVFLHEDRAELWNTVRHEGFHQYLHQFVEDVPIWFNEGYAEYFGFSRRKFGKTVTGQAGDDQRAAVAFLRRGFSPLAQLFLMEQPEFMSKPEVHYVQSWTLIHYLRDAQDPALKGILDRYFDALAAGKGRAGAYRDVFEPVLPAIEKGWKAHLDSLAR